MKFVVVTGGVISGLGKGITISSIGRILKSCGLTVSSIKIDPYLNIDAGTMSPFEHGETFVLDDGGETDLDLGNYERFLDITLTTKHNITTGKIYRDVIQKERRGDYLGKTVQIIPHVTNRIIEWIQEVAQIPVDNMTVDGTQHAGRIPDVCLVEVGGTVGDIESMVFLEALRQLQFTLGKHNVLFVHVSLVPCVGGSDEEEEQKTKPTQHSVKALTSVGIFPDIVVCRCTHPLTESTKRKLSVFCQVPPTHVLSMHNIPNIYHVPRLLLDQNMHGLIRNALFNPVAAAAAFASLLDAPAQNGARPTPLPPPLEMKAPDLTSWEAMAHKLDNLTHTLSIAIVGKYTGQGDTYLSVLKSITHSGVALDVDVKIVWINSTDLEDETRVKTPQLHAQAWAHLMSDAICGMIIPGGFGVRGIEGKILAANYARTHKVPCLGLCLGMQVMCIEFARNVLNQPRANSIEFDAHTPDPTIIYMPETDMSTPTTSPAASDTNTTTQKDMGGTMRLGSRATFLSKYLLNQEPSQAWELYHCDDIIARTPTSEQQQQQQPSNPVAVVYERYRHRYEVNPLRIRSLEEAGLYFSGRGFAEGDDAVVPEPQTSSGVMTVQTASSSSQTEKHKLCRMEIVELPRSVHPYYLGGQFHPEYKSRPHKPAPLFYGFIRACLELHHQRQSKNGTAVSIDDMLSGHKTKLGDDMDAVSTTAVMGSPEVAHTPKRLCVDVSSNSNNTNMDAMPLSPSSRPQNRTLSRSMSLTSESQSGVVSPIRVWNDKKQ